MSQSDRQSHPSLPVTDADLADCAREPIHLLGRVQSFGCLVAASSDWIIQHASQNCAEVLGLALDAAIGERLDHQLPRAAFERLRARMQGLTLNGPATRLFGLDLLDDGRRFDVSIHHSGRSFAFEFERKTEEGPRDDLSEVQPLIGRIARRRGEGLQAMAQEAARGLRALSGFARVKVYQFQRDGSGRVIAEARAPDQKSYLDLRFPASDIPAQARALYSRSLLRLIADVNDPGAAVVPAQDPHGAPLDLSMAVTRAVSPIHIEYLRNMQVGASMSVSIMEKGELWGLFACHHPDPLYLDYERRTAIELFGQLFAYELVQAQSDLERETQRAAQLVHDRMMSRLSDGSSLEAGFAALAEEVGAIIEHDGLVLFSDGAFHASGATPTEAEFLELAKFLNTAATSRVYASDNIAGRYPGGAAFAERAAGLLAMPISRSPRDYIVLFRREIAASVLWAGNPEKAVELGPEGRRLTPRKSFDTWQQLVKGHCAAWTEAERQAAESFRITLLEVVLKLTDEANAERRRAEERQELLIAELNHRVRNILNLIRGLIAQSKTSAGSSALSVEDFTSSLEGRVHALARAHDQLTRKEWAPVSLRALVEVEAAAFVADRMSRVEVTGPDVLIVPEAFSTLALVVHELVTNSVKYGALSLPQGHVRLAMGRGADGALVLDWSETGGPLVRPPLRRGFGTTIIERSIPYEMQGRAEIQFRLSGVTAHFEIPAAFLAAGSEALQPAAPAAPRAVAARLAGPALVVEDALIIAMDAADMLGDLGASDVATASSVAEALRLVGSQPFAFALLDVNLGRESSLPVAQALAARGVPFALATGYGETEEVRSSYPPAPILQKPYTIEMVRAAVAQALSAPGDRA